MVLFLIIITKTKEGIAVIHALLVPATLFNLLAIRSISAGCGSSDLLLCTSVDCAVGISAPFLWLCWPAALPDLI